MTDTREATPRPWRVEEGTTLIWGACDPDDRTTYGMGYPVATAHMQLGAGSPFRYERREDEACANAALIVHAVNHFDEVAEVLRWYASSEAWTARETEGPDGDYGNRARVLLSKLEASHDIR